MAGVGGQLQAPRLHQRAGGIGRVVHLMEHQLVGGVEAALHQHKGAFTALFLALADRVYVAVLGVDRRVKRHAGQIHILPAAVLALVVGNRRQLIRREVAAVRDVVFLDQRILVGHKADTDAAEIAGQIFLRDEILVGQRFGNALVADAVDARDTLVHEGVAGHAAVQRVVHDTGNRTDLFGSVVDHDHGAAVFDGGTAADNAADLLCTGQAALGAALADRGLADTGHAADAGGVLGIEGAKAPAVDDRTHLGVADDAARVLLFGADRAVVCAVTGDDAGLEGKVQRLAARGGVVVLGVQIVLAGHCTGNAAGVEVGIDRAAVDAVRDLGLDVVIGVVIGNIVHDVVCIPVDILAGTGQRLADLVDLLRDRLHVVDQRLAVAAGVVVQAADDVAHAGQAAAQIIAAGRDGIAVRQLDLWNFDVHGVRQGIRNVIEHVLCVGQVVKTLGDERIARVDRIALVRLCGSAVVLADNGAVSGIVNGFGAGLPVGGAVRLAALCSGLLCGGSVLRCRTAFVRRGEVSTLRGLLRGGQRVIRIDRVGVRRRRRFAVVDDCVRVRGIVSVVRAGQVGILEVLLELAQVGLDGLGTDGHAVLGLLQQILNGIAGAGHVVLQRFELVGKLAAGGAGVIAGAVDQRLQRAHLVGKLLQRVLCVFQRAARLHLADDAAALLAGVDSAVVDAALNVAGLAARDAADVVAHVLVAHGAAVHAGADDTAGLARNAADVGDVGDVLGADQVVQRQRGKVDVVLLHRRVDAGGVRAVGNDAVIFTGDAADEVRTVDTARGRAAFDDAGGQICARDAADNGRAGGHALKAAVVQRTGVAARNAAHGGAAAGGHRAAPDDEVADVGPLLHIAEEADDRAVIYKAQAGDRVALPLKYAAEGRDARKAAAGQFQIGVQIDGAVFAPAVQAAGIGQLQKVIDGADVEGLLFGGVGGPALPFRKNGQGQRQHKAERQQRSPEAARQVKNAVHSASPPFVSVSGVSGVPGSGAPSSDSWMFFSDRYMSGLSTVNSVPVAMFALNWPCSTPLISASTTPLM